MDAICAASRMASTERIVEIGVIASSDTLALLDLDIREPRT
jgi:hypothetical protein